MANVAKFMAATTFDVLNNFCFLLSLCWTWTSDSKEEALLIAFLMCSLASELCNVNVFA